MNSSFIFNTSYISLNATNLNAAQIFLFSFFGIIVVCTVALNLFVVISVISDKSLLNFINIKYTSMALADIMVGLVAMPSLVVNTVYGSWPLGENLCILWCLFDFIGCNISSVSLVSIAFYQFKSIKKPFDVHSRSYKIKTFLSMILIWIVPFTFWGISIITIIKRYRHQNSYMDPSQCYLMFTVTYVILANSVFYLTPAILLVVFQVLTYFALKSKNNKIGISSSSKVAPQESKKKESNRKRLEQPLDINSVSRIMHDRSTTLHNVNNFIINNRLRTTLILNKKSKLEKDQKAFRVLLVVATSYLILWCPWITVWPIQAICNCVPNWYYQTTYWMQYSNSLINPLSLIVRQVNFRKKFLNLFRAKNDLSV